jgi:hypothetical protein
MTIYSIALYLHIVGTLGLAVALGLEWIGLSKVRNAQVPDQFRSWMGILKGTNNLGFPSMVTTVVTGIYMMVAVWGSQAWIYVTLGSLLLVIILSIALSRPRLIAIGQSLVKEKGSVTLTLRNLVNHPLLRISIQTRVAIILGIIFLKIAKPDLVGSLLTIGVAIAIGIASSLPAARKEPAREGSAD